MKTDRNIFHFIKVIPQAFAFAAAAIGILALLGWFLGLPILYALLRERLWLMIFLISTLLTGSAACVGLVWRNQQARFYRKQYEMEIQRQALMKNFDYLLKYANDIILLSDQKGAIVELNDRACQSYGYLREELLHMNIHDLSPKEYQTNAEERLDKLAEQMNLVYESIHCRKDGTIFPVEVSSRLFELEEKQFNQSIIRDITERKQAQHDIEASETRYRRLFETAKEGILILNAESEQVIDVNPFIIEMLGYSHDTFVGKRFWEIGLFKDIAASREAFQKLQNKEYLHYDNLPLETKDGRKIDVEFVSNIYQVNSTRVVQCNIRDISERRKAELEIQHMNRLYDVLSQCNQSIVRIREQGKLFKEVCDIIVQRGQFRMAWIGVIDPETRILEPKAWSGFEDGFLQEVFSHVTEEKRRQLPSYLAIDEGRTFFLNDIEHSSVDSLSRQAALQRDYHSMATTPIKLGGMNTGVLTLYSQDLDYFGTKEINLLDEMALDISFALDTYEQEHQRRKAEESLRRSESELKKAQSIAHVGSWVWDIKQDIHEWSDEMYRIFGIQKETTSGPLDNVLFQAIHPDDRQKVAQLDIRAIFEKKPSPIEYRIIWPDQSIHIVWEEAGELTFDKTGAPSKMTGIVQDITDLKRSEEQLLIKNAALESSISAIGLADLDGNLIYANKALVKLWGYIDAQEMLGKHITEFISSMDQLLEALKLIMGGNGYIDERESLKKDGTKFVVQVSANLVTNPDEKPICLMVSFADITERKQIEKAMKLNEEKLKELFEKAPVGYHEIDKLGNITAVNQTELKMLGYTFEQMIGWSVWEFVTDREESRKIILAKLAGNLPPYKTSEQTFTRTDGTSFPALVDDVILRNERGEITGIRSTVLDITDRKRAEEAVRESEEKFRMVFENVLDGISIYSEDPDPSKRRLIECNERYASMAGRSCEELLQLGSTLGLQRTLEDTANNNRLESLARGTVYQGSFSWIRPDGKDNIIEFVGKPIIWQGKPYTIGIDRDITERKHMEEQLRQMQKLEGLGTLAGGIAHDFNNILGIILAYITSIKRFKEDTKKLDFAIDTITKAVDRGKTLVQQILTFARKSETEFGAVNVNDLVMEIMAMIFETFPKIITYAQNFDKTIPLINADRSQLHQALLNLCVNARDAMPSGGVLAINTRMVSSISLRNQHPDALASNYVCIEVSDTGAGMNDEIRKHIYDPFFTTRKKGEGTGLGLAVVFGVIQTHKGFIDVESELGKGTTFHLYLPASYVTEPIGVKDKEMVEEIPGGTETLLVVEDEETLMMSLQIVLAEKGYSVLSAADGMEALDIYKERKNEIALVLTDLGLPKMTGMEEFQRIKQINPSARIIVATGFLDPEMKSELLKAGAKGFVQKPYSPDEILRKIREVLDESHE